MSSTARLTWTDPTARSDGTALAATEIAAINVFMSADNGNNFTQVGQAAAGQQKFDQVLEDPGTYLFKLEVVDTQKPARTSADSVVVSITLEPPPLAAPNPPTNVGVGFFQSAQ